MYATTNFKTKKAFKEAVKSGIAVHVFQPNNMFATKPVTDGVVCVEGPHYPAPHTWYASVTLKGGVVVKVS